ncbi:MAG: Fic family protein [Synergistaceae bacterium]|nr:Fic family protein [Synergistaceae bacterium]
MNKPPYTITEAAADYLAKIAETVTRLEFGTDFKRDIRLHRENRIRSIYSSLAIENNGLTIEQVTDVINGRLVAGKHAEIKEVKNAYEAYDRILTLDPYKPEDFLKAHKLMTNELIEEAGSFRSRDVGVFDEGRAVHIGARPQFVPRLIEELFAWGRMSDLHPLLKSGILHYEIETIHPFADGNGRMGRLWQTLILSKWNDLFAWIPMESVVYVNRQGYYGAIEASRRDDDSGKFIEFMLKALYTSITEQIEHQEKSIARKNIASIDGGENGGEKYRLSATQATVLSAIEANNWVTTEQLIAEVGKTKSTIERAIKTLKEKGLLKRDGPDKGGRWVCGPVK